MTEIENIISIFLIVIITIISIMVLRILFSIITIIFTFPPSIPSEAKLISLLRQILDEIDVNNKKFYDLGSGDGKVCLEIAKYYPKLQVTGVEKFGMIYWISKLRLYFHNAPNLKFIQSDFFEIDLSKADLIFIFLTKSVLNKLLPKFLEELKDGAMIFSNNFQIDTLLLYKKLSYQDIFTNRHLYIYKISKSGSS